MLEKPGVVKEILHNGNENAKKVASKTMEEVRKAMKIDFM